MAGKVEGGDCEVQLCVYAGEGREQGLFKVGVVGGDGDGAERWVLAGAALHVCQVGG